MKLIAILSSVFAFSLLLSSQSYAYDIKYSNQYEYCMKRSDGSLVEVMECITNETKAWDKKLNENYKKFMSKLEGTQKTNFRDIQRDWLKFMQANCGFIYGFDNDTGTNGRISADLCYLRMTAERALEIDDISTNFQSAKP